MVIMRSFSIEIICSVLKAFSSCSGYGPGVDSKAGEGDVAVYTLLLL